MSTLMYCALGVDAITEGVVKRDLLGGLHRHCRFHGLQDQALPTTNQLLLALIVTNLPEALCRDNDRECVTSRHSDQSQ